MNTQPWKWNSESDCLAHFGTQTHSGRYPWGSGSRPYQRLEKAKALVGAGVSTYKKVRRKKIERIITRGNYREIKKNLRRLSDDDLARALRRIETTKKIKDSMKSINKNEATDLGKGMVKDAIKSIGSMIIIPAVTGYFGYALKASLAGDSDNRPKFYEEITKNVNKGK